MRTRAGTSVSAILLAWLASSSLASGSVRPPVSVDVSVRPGRAVVIHLHAACRVRVSARLAVGTGTTPARTATVRRGGKRTLRLALPPGLSPASAQVRASVLGRGCRSVARTLAWRPVASIAGSARGSTPPVIAPPSLLPLSPPTAPPPTRPATPAPPSPSLPAVQELTWAPPQLKNPIVVNVTNQYRALVLDPARDYIVRMPQQPLTASYGLAIAGGHNVVLIGGEIDIPWQGTNPPEDSRRALYLKEQTGTVHIEGLLMTGADLTEGIDLDERQGNTVQIENVRIENIHARDEAHFTDNHPDLIQTWGGPAQLRIDHLTGSTDYQGFFLHPQQFDTNAAMRLADLRNINIAGNTKSGYLLWQADPFAKNLQNVWLIANPNHSWTPLWPNPSAWPGVRWGSPPGGDFVSHASVGTSYRSPGYQQP